MRSILTMALITGLTLGALSTGAFADGCGSHDYADAGKSKKDLVDTAVKAEGVSTLVAAVKAAGLVEALKGDGPFTVFAPTDEAFAKLPKATLESLLLPENKDQLAGILTYHVIPGRLDAKKVLGKSGAVSLNGQRVDFRTEDGKVMVDGATVVATDVDCSNGVIHLIDTVILPASEDLVRTAKGAKAFGTLLAAATEAGLAETLQKDGPFTIFAPTDDAFAQLPEGTVESLLKPENRDQLVSILEFHVVAGRVYSDQAVAAGTAQTISGEPIEINVIDGKAKVQEATIVKTDIDASNGVIHVIDRVILPPRKTADRGTPEVR